MCQFEVDRFSGGERQSIDSRQSALQFSDIRLHLLGNVLSHFFRDVESSNMRFLLDDSNSGLVAWRVNSRNKAPVETADKTGFKRWYLGWRAVCT